MSSKKKKLKKFGKEVKKLTTKIPKVKIGTSSLKKRKKKK